MLSEFAALNYHFVNGDNGDPISKADPFNLPAGYPDGKGMFASWD